VKNRQADRIRCSTNSFSESVHTERTAVPMTKKADFRFYEELNDFLPPERRKTWFAYEFTGKPSVKDAVEAIGVPHAEIDLILVNGESVDFSHHLGDCDRISVYPVFESLDISPVTRLRPHPLREPRFILDVHLGGLARNLRLLGFDTLYENDYDDPDIVAIALRDRRIILTRDVGLLKNGSVTHGYWIRNTNTREQLGEVIGRFDLAGSIRPFSRCLVCNGDIVPVPKDSVAATLEPKTRENFDEFFRCESCGKVYWKGSHYERMRQFVEKISGNTPEPR